MRHILLTLTPLLLATAACQQSGTADVGRKADSQGGTTEELTPGERLAAVDEIAAYRQRMLRDSALLDYCSVVEATGATSEAIAQTFPATRYLTTPAVVAPCRRLSADSAKVWVVDVHSITGGDSALTVVAELHRSGYSHQESFLLLRRPRAVLEHRLWNFRESFPAERSGARSP